MGVVSTMAVANAILQECARRKTSCTPEKLQQLLYIFCCLFLSYAEKPLFSEEFLVGKRGPFLPSVDWKFKCFRWRKINTYAKDAMGNVYTMDLASSAAARHAMADMCELWMPAPEASIACVLCSPDTGWAKAGYYGETIKAEGMRSDVDLFLRKR